MPTRIAIDGVQSTGKTTLFERLRARFGSRFGYVSEASRAVAPGFGVHRASDWDSLLNDQDRLRKFFAALEQWQVQAEDAHDAVIIDSSLFLHFAYKQVLLGESDPELAIRRGYDLILYCPTGTAFVEDGFRMATGRDAVATAHREALQQHFDGTFSRMPMGDARYPAAFASVLAVAGPDVAL